MTNKTDSLHADIVNFEDGFLHTPTGEYFDQTSFEALPAHTEKDKSIKEFLCGKRKHSLILSQINSKQDKTNKSDTPYKHVNSLEYMAKLLNIKPKRCKLINEFYLLSSPAGLLVEHSDISVKINKDWRRTLRTLEHDNWVKRMTHVDSSLVRGSVAQISTTWMINPKFTYTRDKWPKDRQQWLSDGYQSGSLNTFNSYTQTTETQPLDPAMSA